MDARLKELEDIVSGLTSSIDRIIMEHHDFRERLTKAVVDTNWDEVTKVRDDLSNIKLRLDAELAPPAPAPVAPEPAPAPAEPAAVEQPAEPVAPAAEAPAEPVVEAPAAPIE